MLLLVLCRLQRHDSASLAHQVPDEDETVVAARGEHAAAVGAPFDRVDRGAVAAEFEQGLARLAHVEDADEG
jgi:hypothetical protein